MHEGAEYEIKSARDEWRETDRAPAVTVCLERLEAIQQEHRALVDRLADRLGGVLLPERPAAVLASAADREVISPIAERLERLIDVAQAHSARIADITDRVDV